MTVMRSLRALIGLWLLAAALPTPAEPPAKKTENRRFTLGVATWFSTGDTNFAHDSSAVDPLLGNPTSQLDYSGLDSTVIELHAEVRLPWRMSLSGRTGVGSISGGTLLDDDFLSAQGAMVYGSSVTGAHRFSRTESQVEDNDLDYLELGLARHLLSMKKPRRSRLKLFGSARSWSENRVATGLQQIECTTSSLCIPPGPPIPGLVGVPVIAESSEWFVGLVGLEGAWRSERRFELTWRLGFGFAEVETDDIHFLRADLAQDPSFRWTGDGPAFELGFTGSYRLSPRLRLGLGYRMWTARADDGLIAQFDAMGGVGTAPLLEYESRRDGMLVNLEYRSNR
jgi:hypothetical protein